MIEHTSPPPAQSPEKGLLYSLELGGLTVKAYAGEPAVQTSEVVVVDLSYPLVSPSTHIQLPEVDESGPVTVQESELIPLDACFPIETLVFTKDFDGLIAKFYSGESTDDSDETVQVDIGKTLADPFPHVIEPDSRIYMNQLEDLSVTLKMLRTFTVANEDEYERTLAILGYSSDQPQVLGSGTFGTVVKMVSSDGSPVAIKKIQFTRNQDYMRRSCGYVFSLYKTQLAKCQNLVEMVDSPCLGRGWSDPDSAGYVFLSSRPG